MLENESGSWTDELTPEMRAELKELHKINPWISVAKLLTLIALWIGLANLALQLGSWWKAIPCYVVMGLIYHGLGVFAHEGAHGTLLGLGWIDRVVGFFCGLPIGFPCANYRATHLLHHRYENTELDPDNMEAAFKNTTLRQIVYWSWYVVGIYLYVPFLMASGPFRAEGAKEKLICLLESICLPLFYFGLYQLASAYNFLDVLLYGWLMGIPFAAIVANVRGLAEHTQLWHDQPPDPLKSTRTTLSNPIIAFFFNNQNYHLEHHLFPRVPWYNLGRVNRLLQPIYEARGASIAEGYWQFLNGSIKWGPLRSFSYTPDHKPVLNEN